MKTCERMNRLETALQRLLVETGGLDDISRLMGENSGVVSGAAFLDLHDIYHRVGGEAQRVLEVLRIVGESREELIEMIDSAQKSLDLDGLRAVAHALRGVFLEASATVCADVALRVESIDKPIVPGEAQSLLCELRKCVMIVTSLTQALILSEQRLNDVAG